MYVSDGRSEIQRLRITRLQCLLAGESPPGTCKYLFLVTMNYANDFHRTLCLVVITEKRRLINNLILAALDNYYIMIN